MEKFAEIVSQIDGIVWGIPMIVILFGTHLFMTFRTGIVQRHLFKGIRLSVSKDEDGEGEISQFGALATALAATIGTGNIVGVATAVVSGGPGAVFWMWIIGVFGMATKYSETLMSVKYRVQTKDGRMLGGAACMVGHMFPLMFGFHGGKGVLCGAALAACMDWRAFCIVFGVFLIAVLLTRYISLGSLLAAVAYPFAFAWCFWGNWAVIAIALAVAVLAIWMHRGNIGRLAHGNERKFHLKKGKDGEA